MLFVGALGIIAGLFVSDHPLWTSLAATTTFAVILGLIGIFMGVSKIVMAFQGAGWWQGIMGVLITIECYGVVQCVHRGYRFTISFGNIQHHRRFGCQCPRIQTELIRG